jgi:hypothetical protein
LASLAFANVPDLVLSDAAIAPGAVGASVFVLPNATGANFAVASLPGGTVDATITVTLVDEFGDPIFLYPFEDMWLETSLGGLVFCPGGTVADASTDALGETTFSNPIAGGGNSLGEVVMVMIAGAPLVDTVNLTFNSADINGDLLVNLSDIVNFTPMLNSYNYNGDFNNDGVINLSDIVRFTPGIGTTCN